jgi:outer membrane biogenesis lipoprotein LolB
MKNAILASCLFFAGCVSTSQPTVVRRVQYRGKMCEVIQQYQYEGQTVCILRVKGPRSMTHSEFFHESSIRN